MTQGGLREALGACPLRSPQHADIPKVVRPPLMASTVAMDVARPWGWHDLQGTELDGGLAGDSVSVLCGGYMAQACLGQTLDLSKKSKEIYMADLPW